MGEKSDFIMKPKVDFCFKELMEDPEVRRGFIAAILHILPESITETILLPTHLRVYYEEDKLGILDVRMLLNGGEQIDVEIQIAPFVLWPERSLFYLGKMYTGQIEKGAGYEVLQKCIHIGILDFVLFAGEKEYYSCFHLREDTRHSLYTDKLEVHILELAKLKKYEYPETELLQWATFMNAESREEFEEMAGKNKYLEKAYESLVNISADEEKRLEYEAREKALRDHDYLMKSNWEAGHEAGKGSGKAEAVVDLLTDKGIVPEDLKEMIMAQKDLQILKQWIKLAAKVDSVEEFRQKIAT